MSLKECVNLFKEFKTARLRQERERLFIRMPRISPTVERKVNEFTDFDNQ